MSHGHGHSFFFQIIQLNQQVCVTIKEDKRSEEYDKERRMDYFGYWNFTTLNWAFIGSSIIILIITYNHRI